MVLFPLQVCDRQVPGTSSQKRGRQCSPTAHLCRTHPMALRKPHPNGPLKIDGTCHPGDLRHRVLSLGRHCGSKGITKGESENHRSTATRSILDPPSGELLFILKHPLQMRPYLTVDLIPFALGHHPLLVSACAQCGHVAASPSTSRLAPWLLWVSPGPAGLGDMKSCLSAEGTALRSE